MRNEYNVLGDYAEIILNRKNGMKLKALVDIEDIEVLLKIETTWVSQYSPLTKSYYVVANSKKENGKRTKFILHRIIMNTEKGMIVDHINHDTLDNRKQNLRLVTQSENQENRLGATRKSKTGIRNVSYHKTSGLWVVVIGRNNKRVCLGHFKTLEEAEKVAIEGRKKLMKFAPECDDIGA
ncbi:HNH endonuclease [Paenibacillus sp. FSL L8-0499]|uniref:HNH endonuclease n=1 Tax=Paenibacillus sp. FSL L8-0499 TaxID=2975334 RepID=UPI0030F4D25A